MERLGSAKWLEIFERFRDLKKVKKHCLLNTVQVALVIRDRYALVKDGEYWNRI
jgi:hypothetical protein